MVKEDETKYGSITKWVKKIGLKSQNGLNHVNIGTDFCN